MKKSTYILVLLITLSIICLFAISSQQNTAKRESIHKNLESVTVTLQGQIGLMAKYNTERQEQLGTNKLLLDKIDSLTRQNTVLMQEVASQANQIDAYGKVYGE